MIRTAVIFSNYGPYVLARADALARSANIDPHFIELASELKKYPWRTERDDVVRNLRTLSQRSFEQTPFHELYTKLSRVLEEIGPKAVVIPSYSPPIMLAAARWAKKHGAASIMMNETTEMDHPRVWWKEGVKGFLLDQYYDAAFVGGTATCEYLLKLGMSREQIWEGYDVIDNDYFRREAEHVMRNSEQHRKHARLPERYFLYVGRFSPEKNLPRLLEAYRLYREREPDGWGLTIVGDGPQRADLHEMAAGLDLTDLVWPGFKQADVLPVYYALASAFVLPSTSEPWGLVVNEAMACGLPVLVSNRCGSAWDLVSQEHNGYTFDPYEIQEVTEGMLKMSASAEMERLAMGEVSQEIISGYTPDSWAANLSDCIVQTVERPKVKRSLLKRSR